VALMAIRSYPWMDGFDYYATDRLTYKWASASNIHVSPTGGRRNSGCIVPTGAGYLVSPDFESYNPTTEAWVDCEFLSISFALYRQTLDAFKVIAQPIGGYQDIEFEFTCSGRIGYREGGGTWYYTDGIVPFCEWCHVTLYYDFDNYICIRVLDSHGNVLIDDLISGFELGFTDLNFGVLKSWRIESAACGNWRIDDLYINAAIFKDVLLIGDCRIDALEMASDDPSSDYDFWTFTSLEDFSYTVSQRPETVTSNDVSAKFACYHAGVPHDPASITALQVNIWDERLGTAGFFITSGGETTSEFIDATVTAETGHCYTWTTLDGNPLTKDAVNAAAIGVQCSV
jgi:hypothetical protein